MKNLFRTLFSPLLKLLEAGGEDYHYKPINRTVLLIFGVIFCSLGSFLLTIIPADSDVGYYLPVVVFITAGATGLIVGLLGNDRAVAKIWGNK